MADQNTKVGVTLSVDGSQAQQSVGNIRKELKAANAELIAAQKNFGDYSAEAIAAAKKVAQLKDSVAEAAETAALFDPGKKFAAFSGALNAVAGGFSAVQGALGLLGVESEEVQKQLLKVQSALALSQGLSTITDSAKDFARLGAVIKTQVVTAFSTLKGAIAATGIGALVVGIGLLITNFDKVYATIQRLIPGFDGFVNGVKNAIQAVTDFIGITSEQERALEKLGEETERINKQRDNTIKILTAQGGKEKEIFEVRQSQIKDELNLLNERARQGEKLTKEELQRQQDLSADLVANDVAEKRRLRENAEKAEKERQQRRKELADKQKQEREEERQRLLQEEQEANKIRREQARQETEVGIKEAERRRAEILAQDPVIAGADARLKAIGAEAALVREQREKERKEQEVYAQFFILNEKTKRDALRETGNALNAIADIVGKQTAAGKVLAISQALINTFLGITEVLRNKTILPEPAGTIQKVASIVTISAAGFSAVRNIAKTQVPGAGGGGGGVPSGVGGGAPIAPTTPQAAITQLDQQTVNRLQSATTRAYVVESDVTSGQERIRRLNRAARLG